MTPTTDDHNKIQISTYLQWASMLNTALATFYTWNSQLPFAIRKLFKEVLVSIPWIYHINIMQSHAETFMDGCSRAFRRLDTFTVISPTVSSTEIGLCSVLRPRQAPTQYRLYGRRFLQVKRPNQQYQSTEGTYSTQTNQTYNNQTINTKHSIFNSISTLMSMPTGAWCKPKYINLHEIGPEQRGLDTVYPESFKQRQHQSMYHNSSWPDNDSAKLWELVQTTVLWCSDAWGEGVSHLSLESVDVLTVLIKFEYC